jgi:hypothetical protein
MAHALTFRLDERLHSIIDHAVKSPEMREYYGTKIGPSLLLVKDEGIYLMSAGNPAQQDEEAMAAAGGATRLLVQYANGYDPTKRDRMEVWDDAHRVSGDDFGEPLPLDFFQRAVANGAKNIIIHWGGDSYRMEAR